VFATEIQATGLDDITCWLTKFASICGLNLEPRPKKMLRREYLVNECGFLCKIDFKALPSGETIEIHVPLANFSPKIIEEISEDDGQEITRKYVLEGCCENNPLPKIEVLAAQFLGMSWICRWGSKVIIEPGPAFKDQVRHAIQTMSKDARYRDVFTHTGWRKIGDNMVFLTHGSAIGGTDIDVQLARETARYTAAGDIGDIGSYEHPIHRCVSENRF
jgi:hypothetical protein